MSNCPGKTIGTETGRRGLKRKWDTQGTRKCPEKTIRQKTGEKIRKLSLD